MLLQTTVQGSRRPQLIQKSHEATYDEKIQALQSAREILVSKKHTVEKQLHELEERIAERAARTVHPKSMEFPRGPTSKWRGKQSFRKEYGWISSHQSTEWVHSEFISDLTPNELVPFRDRVRPEMQHYPETKAGAGQLRYWMVWITLFAPRGIFSENAQGLLKYRSGVRASLCTVSAERCDPFADHRMIDLIWNYPFVRPGVRIQARTDSCAIATYVEFFTIW